MVQTFVEMQGYIWTRKLRRQVKKFKHFPWFCKTRSDLIFACKHYGWNWFNGIYNGRVCESKVPNLGPSARAGPGESSGQNARAKNVPCNFNVVVPQFRFKSPSPKVLLGRYARGEWTVWSRDMVRCCGRGRSLCNDDWKLTSQIENRLDVSTERLTRIIHFDVVRDVRAVKIRNKNAAKQKKRKENVG